MLRIKALREQRHLNQEGLALKLNVSQSTISAYEVGERTPDLKTLMALAAFFDVSLDYLVGLSDRRQTLAQGDLSAEELALLAAYRRLDVPDKARLNAYIDGLAGR